MMPSNSSSSPQSTDNKKLSPFAKRVATIFLIISLIGFIDASFLTMEHYAVGGASCGTGGCETVTTSAYATAFGIPVALGGALYYLAILLGSIFVLDQKKEAVLKMLSLMTIVGFVASIYFVSLQLFVINEICRYCMISATTSTLLFIIGMHYLKKQKKLEKIEVNGV